jgi:hypothetical protein
VEYREKNRDRLKAISKSYYEANKEKHLAQCKAYAEANKEKTLAYKKQWYEDNKQELLVKHKEYRESHKEQNALSQKAWREANPERIKALCKRKMKEYSDNLSDYYVNLKIRKGTNLKSKDIPKELTEAKRVAILIERELRETLPKGRRNPQKRKEQQRANGIAWRERNKEYKRERDRLYRQAHKERHNELNKLSRARVKARKQLTQQQGEVQ